MQAKVKCWMMLGQSIKPAKVKRGGGMIMLWISFISSYTCQVWFSFTFSFYRDTSTESHSLRPDFKDLVPCNTKLWLFYEAISHDDIINDATFLVN